MVRQVVIGNLRVQQIQRKDGRRSWTIVWPEGTEHPEADRFLRVHDGSGTQRTYAYLLVDHLRWLERECLTFDAVGLRDLERYMGILGAEVRMPLGEPWRVGKRPYGRSALSTTAACLKGFYLAEDALKAANTEILNQRTRIGELLGQIRDLQAEWTEEAIQRITTENTTLKQRVRQLTTDSRTLDERLKAARSNLRFQDRRVADLEAQITQTITAT